ncbi:MAG: hypothetical protein HY652_05585, partial [Acidobacteria bacterium]|nr:hypothetical protein [Acidobacteriota bacterium]
MAGNRARTLKILGGLMLFFLLSFILTQLFLRPTSVGSPKFGAATVLVAVFSALNFLLIMVLAFVLGRNLIKLYFERRAQKPGARFKTRLVVSLIALSLT